jgi:hypothetical protein
MKTNEGSADRIVRLVLGIALLGVALGVLGISSIGGIIAAVVGVVMLVTAAIGFCPAYAIFGFKTCPLAK